MSDQKDIITLDITRGLLGLGIVLYHLHFLPVGFGQAIMEGFFALSGFLVTKSLFSRISDIALLQKKDIISFWYRRVKRLGLALWVYILISIICMLTIPGHQGSATSFIVGLTSPFFLSNYFIIQGVLEGQNVAPFGAVWSLAIEEQFYILLPLLFGLIIWIMKKTQQIFSIRPLLFGLATVAFLSIIFRLQAYMIKTPITIETYQIQYRMFGFALGSCSYLIIPLLPARVRSFIQLRGNQLGTLLIGIMSAVCLTVKSYDNLTFLLQWAIVPVLAAVLCMVFFLGANRSHIADDSQTKVQKVFAYFGKISYSLYLYHPLVIFLLASVPGLKIRLFALLLSMLCGIASFELVEKRFTSMVFRTGRSKKNAAYDSLLSES